MRSRGRGGGDFLFGAFGAADAFYAPVVWRLVTYEVPVPPGAERYMASVQSLASMKEWVQAARAENEYLAMDEPYRPAPTG